MSGFTGLIGYMLREITAAPPGNGLTDHTVPVLP